MNKNIDLDFLIGRSLDQFLLGMCLLIITDKPKIYIQLYNKGILSIKGKIYNIDITGKNVDKLVKKYGKKIIKYNISDNLSVKIILDDGDYIECNRDTDYGYESFHISGPEPGAGLIV